MRSYTNRIVVGIVWLSLSMGCSSLPSRYVQQAEPGVTLTSLTESAQAYQGKTVILGGVVVSNASALPPHWKHWARVTVVGRVTSPTEVASSIDSTGEPVLTLLFMRGWTMGQAQQGGAWEESVDANYLLSVPGGIHGE